MRYLKKLMLSVMLAFGLNHAAGAAPITPFSVTDGGLTVGFSGWPQIDTFEVSNTIRIAPYYNNSLFESLSTGTFLVISFSQPIASLQLDFALVPGGFGDLTYWTYWVD